MNTDSFSNFERRGEVPGKGLFPPASLLADMEDYRNRQGRATASESLKLDVRQTK